MPNSIHIFYLSLLSSPSPHQGDVPGCGRGGSVQWDGEGVRHGGRGPEETGVRVLVFLCQPQPGALPAGHQHAEEGLPGPQPHGAQPGPEEHDQPQVGRPSG